jgi:hypothetical protein
MVFSPIGRLRANQILSNSSETAPRMADEATIRGVNAFLLGSASKSRLRTLSYPCTIQRILFERYRALAAACLEASVSSKLSSNRLHIL